MNIILISIVFGLISGSIFKIIDILREHKKRLNRIEDFLFGEVIAKDEVDDE